MPKIQYLHKTRQGIPDIYAQMFGDILQNMNFSRYYRNRGKFIYGFDPNIILLIYANVNLCAWIFQAINVRSFSASSFRDLKNSNEKAQEQNWQIYYDWQQTKRKADMFVTFVMYTKVWILAVIVLTIIFSIGLPFNKKNSVNTVNNHVYTLQAELIENTYDESAVAWNSVLAELQTDKYTEVLILYNEASIDDIKDKLKQFSHQKIILLTDNTLKKNEIKIILEK